MTVLPDYAVVCAWCSATMRAGARPASHGICAACAKTQRARWRTSKPASWLDRHPGAHIVMGLLFVVCLAWPTYTTLPRRRWGYVSAGLVGVVGLLLDVRWPGRKPER